MRHNTDTFTPLPKPTPFSVGAFTVAPCRASDGSYPAKEFFDSLSDLDRQKLRALFDYIAAIGKIQNREKFKKIEGMDDLFEFKSHQLRFPCFWGKQGVLFITHGFRKKQDRTPESEKQRARTIMESHRRGIQ